MRKRSPTIALFILGGAMFLSLAAAESGLRCGSKLVSSGDSREEVLDKCGPPAIVSKSAILRRPTYVLNGHHFSVGRDMVEVIVENWTYNFGPNRLMHRLRFVDGLLEDSETLGYGHNED